MYNHKGAAVQIHLFQQDYTGLGRFGVMGVYYMLHYLCGSFDSDLASCHPHLSNNLNQIIGGINK
jgi:hypothetical protein